MIRLRVFNETVRACEYRSENHARTNPFIFNTQKHISDMLLGWPQPFQTNAASKHVYFNKAHLNLEKELLQFLTSQLCCATLLDNCAP